MLRGSHFKHGKQTIFSTFVFTDNEPITKFRAFTLQISPGRLFSVFLLFLTFLMSEGRLLRADQYDSRKEVTVVKCKSLSASESKVQTYLSHILNKP